MWALIVLNSQFDCHLTARLHRIRVHGFRTLTKVDALKQPGNVQPQVGRCTWWRHPRSKGTAVYQFRTIVQPPQKFSPKYHQDKVPKDYEMIYQANLGQKHTRVLFLIGFIAIGYIGLISYFILLFNGEWESGRKFTLPVVDKPVSAVKFILANGMVLFAIIWTRVGMNFARLPVQRIYECPNKEKYIGILKKTGLTRERVEFTLKDVTALPLKSGQILRQGNAIIQGRHCLIYATDFKTTNYFNKFLGYDPPDNAKNT